MNAPRDQEAGRQNPARPASEAGHGEGRGTPGLPGFLPEDALNRLLQGVLTAHPEHAALIRAFSPLLRVRTRFLAATVPTEGAPDGVPAGEAAGKPAAPAARALPDPACCLNGIEAERVLEAMLAVLEAVEEGFGGADAVAGICAGIRSRLSPDRARDLCQARLQGLACKAKAVPASSPVSPPASPLRPKEAEQALSVQVPDAVREMVADLGQQQALAAELLALVGDQTCRLLAASLRAGGHAAGFHGGEAASPGLEDSRRCPCCGALPELSVVHGLDGRRALVCGLCGHFWRYRRTACPACGAEGPGVLQAYFVEARPEEQGVACTACGRYVLELDIRHLDLAPDQCQALVLGIGHLDILLQQDGMLPLSGD